LFKEEQIIKTEFRKNIYIKGIIF